MPITGEFIRYSEARLSDLLRLHPVSAAGRHYIECALKEPSRNVQGGTNNLIADRPCPKMGFNIQCESVGTERPFVLEHIFDPDILGYITQPPQINLDYLGRGGRRVRSRYTPDCLTFHVEHGIVIEEWKPASDRDKLDQKYPGKFARDGDGQFTAGPIAEAAKEYGFGFLLHFSDEINEISHANRENLLTYLHPESDALYAPHLEEILNLFQAADGIPYQELVARDPNSQDTLNWAIAHGILHIEMSQAPMLTEPEALLVFRHRETMEAWLAAVAPDGKRPDLGIEPFSPELQRGDVIVADDVRYVVEVPGASTTFAIDPRGNHVPLSFEVLRTLHRMGKLIVPERPAAVARASRFRRTSPYAFGRALRMLGILKKLETGARLSTEECYSPSTIRRYRRKIEDGMTKGLSPVESIVDEIDRRGNRGPHIDPTFSERLNGMILARIGSPLCPTRNSMHADIKHELECTGEADKMISVPAFYERVKALRTVKEVQSSQGHKNAYGSEPLYWMLDVKTPIHCERFMQLVHFDSTLLDIELRSSITGEIIGRPWLSLAVCAYTRRVVGMHLSFRPPSYESSMMLLADIVRRFGRIPDGIIHDWGSEFKAKDFKDALTALFIERFVRPKSAPRFGAVIERMFGILTTELIGNLRGNTKLRKNVRSLSPAVDPSTHSGLYLVDLYEGLENFFFEAYANRRHPATLQAPASMSEQSLLEQGMRLHRIKRYEDLMPVLMPRARGRPRVLDPSRGLYVNYQHYGHPSLARLSMAGKGFTVRVIHFDPGAVLAFTKDSWIVCKSKLSRALESTSEAYRRCLFEEWRIEKSIVDGENTNWGRAKVYKLIDMINQKALQNDEYWRDRNARQVLNFGVTSEDPQSQPNMQSTQVLADMMQAAARNFKPPDADYVVIRGDDE